MIKEMILNSFAKCLSKRDREALHYEDWEV